MQKIIVFTIFVLVAFTANVKAQSTWNHPWPGSTHSYMASVTDPENDNPVRWYVAVDPAGTVKAGYNDDYSFVSSGYNASKDLLEGTAQYVVQIQWGTNLGNYYVVFEVEDNVTHCTNRMSLPVSIEAVFNATVFDDLANPSCPGDVVNPLWNGSNQTDIGNTKLSFRILRENSALEWQFEYALTETASQPFSIDSIRFIDELGDPATVLSMLPNHSSGVVRVNAISDGATVLIYVRNQMGVTLDFDFDLVTSNDQTKDAENSLDSKSNDNTVQHSIWPMPVIMNFSGN